MAFRNKSNFIKELNPDIVVVPECENLGNQTSHRLWVGENRNKGIGIFSYSDFEIELYPNYNPSFKFIIPIIYVFLPSS